MNSNHSSKVKEELSSIILLLRRNYAFFLVLAMYILSSSLWLIVELQKLYSFHAFVYDLGAQVSSLNSIARTYSISKLLILVPASKPFTLFISYITLVFPDPGTFLYIQSFGTLLASVFIYLIARRKYGSEPISVALALSFIFFFPISWYLFLISTSPVFSQLSSLRLSILWIPGQSYLGYCISLLRQRILSWLSS